MAEKSVSYHLVDTTRLFPLQSRSDCSEIRFLRKLARYQAINWPLFWWCRIQRFLRTSFRRRPLRFTFSRRRHRCSPHSIPFHSTCVRHRPRLRPRRPPNPNISHPLWNPFQLQTLGSPDIISLSPPHDGLTATDDASGVEEWRSGVKNSRASRFCLSPSIADDRETSDTAAVWW